ncbi:MAG: methyltransferase domain-containing protein [Rhodobacteraceae bacterium]|nr:methyltransferase domain-containing protein [Paracoccaceae bacterium]
MLAEGLAARTAAVGLLGMVLTERLSIAEAVANAQGPLTGLTPSDKARAQRLTLATLRHLEQCDQVLKPYLRKTPPHLVQNTLRLAITELATGGTAHGVVNAAVDIVRRDKRTGHMAGLVNAVLRKVPKNPLEGLPVQKMPRWLRQPLVHAYGREVVRAIETIQAKAPPLDISLREGGDAPDGEMLPTGSLRLTEAGQISRAAGFTAGDWWVQDAAAALTVKLLAPVAGERVLDLCAAPGGKTLQLAAAKAKVTALDISRTRMERVRENLARTGLVAELVVADVLQWSPDTLFDAVLLDAPCSATGTIRRHPDLPFIKDGSELPELIALQAKMLDRALSFVKSGGRMIFCTCSLLPDEGETQLSAALERHPNLRVKQVNITGVDAGWWTKAGGLRLRPDHWAERGGMDGFFMVQLVKP